MGEVIEVPGTTEDELRQAVLADVTGICQPLTLIRPDEVTIGGMAREWGQSGPTARRILDKAVEAGTMERRKALSNGRECWAYRVVS